MASSSPQSPGASPASQRPLFYREPQPLSPAGHLTWRLKQGDVSFAADSPFVPIVTNEFAAAQRCYPIVFAAADATPVAVLGLEHRNLFVTDGAWSEDAYIPALVRRYPFGVMSTPRPEQFVLAIDAGSDRIARGGEEGVALFEEGKPSALTQQAIRFCEAFQAESRATRTFAEALIAQKLLIDRRADATLNDGRKLGLGGFQIIDAQKFAKLDDAVVLQWHRTGWLALAHFHLASLERFSALVARQSARTSKTVAARALS
jgi:hypothetical protein